MNDTIIHDNPNVRPQDVPVENDEDYVKHIVCDGARFHVMYWTSNGVKCTEKKCIINKGK